MNGTAFGLVIGLAYGAIVGIFAYRWYANERRSIDSRLDVLREQQYELSRRLREIAPEESAA